ncbi:MAG TPA: hypothetical protein PKO06_14730, partial [Candidatus Ozemobacteraceae bacterium]|nr:hypothetical protein [Candidatus Ozemobacteraceae bacterium]
MAKTSKKVREWKPQPQPLLTFWQKSFLVGILLFIPFFLLVMLPLIARNHIVKNMKIYEDQLFAMPETINLVRTDLEPAFFKLKIDHLFIRVPRNMTPVRIEPNAAVFRANPRRISRTLAVAAHPDAAKVFEPSLGLLRFFMPRKPLDYLDAALHSDYHPVRQLCKAYFLAGQGVSGKVFKAEWDIHHRGYIVPNPGQTGWIGRVFCEEGDGMSEVSLYDESVAATLRDWVNIALTVHPHASPTLSIENAPIKPLMDQAVRDEKAQNQVIETCLNEYYANHNPKWSIPLAVVLQRRGYLREVIEMGNYFSPLVKTDVDLAPLWQEIIDQTMTHFISIELDLHPKLNRLRLKCRNKTDLPLRNVKLQVTVKTSKGERQFPVLLFDQG